jgi:hypothetical protein
MSYTLTEEIFRDTTKSLDSVFNQESPYKYPALIICRDPKRDRVDNGIYKFYMDSEPVIINGCREVFNTRNPNTASELQAGYARNIDLDSELKHINFYEDKSFHNNRKIDPYEITDNCNGLRRHAKDVVIDYQPVGERKDICVDNYPPPSSPQYNSPKCHNTAPDDRGYDKDHKARYVHDQRLQQSIELHGSQGDFRHFERAPTPEISGSQYRTTSRQEAELLKRMKTDPRYARTTPDFYKFHGGMINPNCKSPQYTTERLFNNITKRSMIPNFHNVTDINPKIIA